MIDGGYDRGAESSQVEATVKGEVKGLNGVEAGLPGDERPIWRFRKAWCFSFVGALVI